MKLNDIQTLLKNTQSPCVSITIPIDQADATKTHELLKKSIHNAKALLKAEAVNEDTANHLVTELDRVTTRFPETLSKGIGIFVSPAISFTLPFPFEVMPKVTVGDSFELRDVHYLQQYSEVYYILNLSKKGVHLFEGSLNEITEVKDEQFPLQYEDQFEYQRASITNGSSSSMKSFEKDKNEISEIRLKSVFREADVLLRTRFTPKTQLLLAGTQRMISLFIAITGLKKQVIGKISGSYNENNLPKLNQAAWTAMVNARKRRIEQQVKDLYEQNGHVANGLQQAWNSAYEGKGLTLLVEKDLRHRAYRKDSDSKLHLQPPKRPYTVVPDAVDQLIETVQSKNGNVIFTENNQLKDFNHVALVLRY